jgi:hypothetical protein
MRISWAVFAALLIALCGPQPAQAQSAPVKYHVWVKSFIPNKHDTNPGYIRPVPGQAGKFMIPGPGIPGTNGPLPWVGSCYNTNNRGFSTAFDAEAKVTTGARFESNGAAVTGFSRETPQAPNTLQYDCATGAVTCDKPPNPAGLAVDDPAVAAGMVRLRMRGEGTNPCVGAPESLTPAIKYDLTAEFDPAAGYVSIKGTLAQFPSYEAYVQVGQGQPTMLFTESPAPGSTAWSLLFNRSIDKTVRYVALDGVWKSDDPGSRFTLKIQGDQVEWSERSAGGQGLGRTVSLVRKPGKGYKLERANDGEVLTFLGFSPAIQAAVQAIGPQPSFLELRIDGDRLAGMWNGILVIKDNQGKFKELKQPGTTAAKPYNFVKQ